MIGLNNPTALTPAPVYENVPGTCASYFASVTCRGWASKQIPFMAEKLTFGLALMLMILSTDLLQESASPEKACSLMVLFCDNGV